MGVSRLYNVSIPLSQRSLDNAFALPTTESVVNLPYKSYRSLSAVQAGCHNAIRNHLGDVEYNMEVSTIVDLRVIQPIILRRCPNINCALHLKLQIYKNRI